MSYKIATEECIGCSACVPECPNGAICECDDGLFKIDASLCNECKSFYDDPQCAEICPIDDVCVPA